MAVGGGDAVKARDSVSCNEPRWAVGLFRITLEQDSVTGLKRVPDTETQIEMYERFEWNHSTLESKAAIPTTMLAAVYRGKDDVRLETVPVPAIGPGELLVRVHTCGICGTDLKKIATGSHSAPRIFGHETSGMVAAVGEGVEKFRAGDRVMVFHHIPCGNLLLLPAQNFCPVRDLQESGLHGRV